MTDSLLQVGNWFVDRFADLWNAFGTWGIIGFWIIFAPILRKLIQLFRMFTNKK